MGRATVSIAIVICAAAVALIAQTQAPRFEVASVRLNPESTQLSQRLTDTRVDISAPLNWVLFWAFRAQYYEQQISAPTWLTGVHVDIHATVPAGATVAQVPEMLQRLLAERFDMVVHREMRQTDGYELVVGPDGMKMLEVEPVNDLRKEFAPQVDRNGRPMSDTTQETPEGTVRRMSIPNGTRTITSRTMYERHLSGDGGAVFTATRMTMAELAPYLWELMDAPVVDNTGLTGVYQFTLTIPRGAMAERIMRESMARQGFKPSSPVATVGVSGGKAIESLGLKVERRRVPIEVIVVDKISRTPTEN